MQHWTWTLVAFVAAITAFGEVATAEPPPKQSYSQWTKDSGQDRYRCTYYYKVPGTPTYGRQYCYYFPSQPQWLYWYKPGGDFYWARCPSQHHPEWIFGQEQWCFHHNGAYTPITNDCPVVTPTGPKEPNTPGTGGGDDLVINPPPVPDP